MLNICVNGRDLKERSVLFLEEYNLITQNEREGTSVIPRSLAVEGNETDFDGTELEMLFLG